METPRSLTSSGTLALLLAFVLIAPSESRSQCVGTCGGTLLRNGDFEINTPVCTTINNGQLYTDQTPVQDWYGTAGVNSPNNGITPDNFNSNCLGNSTLNCGSGVGSLGFYTYTGSGNLREFVQSPLTAPLQAGREYCFSTQVRNGPGSFQPSDGLGIWFTNQMVDITTMNGGNSFLGPGSQINATPYWMLPPGDLISGCATRTGTFCAQGGETWIVIGNFRDDASTGIQGGGFITLGYLIIDNVSLSEVCSVPLTIQADQDSIPCDGSTNLTASGGGGTYTWIPDIGNGPGPHIVSPRSTTTYRVVSEVRGNCGTYSDTAEVTIRVGACGPTVAVNSGTICQGGCMDLIADVSGAGTGATIRWDPDIGTGAGPIRVCPGQTTQYIVTVTDTQGRSSSSTSVVTVLPKPIASFTATPPSPQGPGTTVLFTDRSPPPPPATTTGRSWSFGPGDGGTDSVEVRTFDTPGTYRVTFRVTNSLGCSDSTGIDYIVRPLSIRVPNVFSPNNDGKNDRFIIENLEFYKNELTIYSRWGNVVFEAANYRNTWAAADVTDGTYYYVLRLTEEGGETYTGHVTILR